MTAINIVTVYNNIPVKYVHTYRNAQDLKKLKRVNDNVEHINYGFN